MTDTPTEPLVGHAFKQPPRPVTDLASHVALDGEKGITILLHWAAVHKIVLNEYHEELAKKYNVAIPEEVIISRPIIGDPPSQQPESARLVESRAERDEDDGA